jgi:hypothetical protein
MSGNPTCIQAHWPYLAQGSPWRRVGFTPTLQWMDSWFFHQVERRFHIWELNCQSDAKL